ncbi:MAG: efflux RND transporter periplasmic adaptor subunit, partial [Bacteroidota bacterium]
SEGDFVQTGQTVARLDDTLLRLQVEALDVQIEGHSSDLRRYEVLTSAEAVPGVQLEKTRLALKAAEVQRKTLLEQISRTAIRAPFPGIVTLKMVETGAVIAPGVPLAQLTDIRSLKLTVSVPEVELSRFRKGQNLNAKADALPGKTLAGQVSLVGSKGDAAHNFAVQVLVKNPQPDALKAGMYGSVIFAEKAAGQVLAIPLSALTGSAKSAQVFVVENGKARLREVRLGVSGERYAQVLAGLQTGEIVVTGGLVNLEEGTPVRF